MRTLGVFGDKNEGRCATGLSLFLIIGEQHHVTKILAACQRQPLAVARVGKIEDEIVVEEGNLAGSSAGQWH